MDSAATKSVSLKDAISTLPLDSHKYRAHISSDHCYQSLAHGGLLASIVLSATQHHFRSTLSQVHHPDTFNLDLVFLRPAVEGVAMVTIRDVKLGSLISIVHCGLTQNGTERVAGYVLNTSMAMAKGISLPTPVPISPESAPIDFVKAVADNSDSQWIGYTVPYFPTSIIKPITHFQMFSPRQPSKEKNLTEVWLRFIDPQQRFETAMLGSIADHWHRMPENYLAQSKWNNVNLPAAASLAATTGSQLQGYTTSFMYPTLSLQLEVKKPLPPAGADWLLLRAQSHEIKNGRFDANIMILNESLEIVALSHQVCLISKGMQIPDVLPKSRQDGKL
ncbi:hypothetical protein MMC25_005770 [Agyrium rufum]|nr:hypothetical protein [Agyrium rufum]